MTIPPPLAVLLFISLGLTGLSIWALWQPGLRHEHRRLEREFQGLWDVVSQLSVLAHAGSGAAESAITGEAETTEAEPSDAERERAEALAAAVELVMTELQQSRHEIAEALAKDMESAVAHMSARVEAAETRALSLCEDQTLTMQALGEGLQELRRGQEAMGAIVSRLMVESARRGNKWRQVIAVSAGEHGES